MWEHLAASPSILSCTLAGSKSPSGIEEVSLVKADPAVVACPAVRSEQEKETMALSHQTTTLTTVWITIGHFGGGLESIFSECVVILVPDRALEGLAGSVRRLKPQVFLGDRTRGLERGMTEARRLMNPFSVPCVCESNMMPHCSSPLLRRTLREEGGMDAHCREAGDGRGRSTGGPSTVRVILEGGASFACTPVKPVTLKKKSQSVRIVLRS